VLAIWNNKNALIAEDCHGLLEGDFMLSQVSRSFGRMPFKFDPFKCSPVWIFVHLLTIL
jgi:hypothetical protein